MSSILSNFNPAKLLGNMFANNQSVIGIDIGSSSVKIVQLKKKRGHPVLETYGELALGPYAKLSVGQATNLAAVQIGEAIRDLIREANVTAKLAAIALPLHSSLLTVIELPAYKEEQINSMVPLEARKHIPVPISEVTLDWWVIPKHDFHGPAGEQSSPVKSTNTEVLLVAIHKSTLKKFQEVSATLGISVKTYEVETFSAMRSCLARDISAMAMLDVGASTSKLTIVDYGVVRVSHVINKGSQDLSVAMASAKNVTFAEAEKEKRQVGIVNAPGLSASLDFIFYEAASTIAEYEKRHARQVGKVICTGGGSLLKDFIKMASSRFNSEIVLGTPFDKVESPAFLAGLLAEAGPEFAVALGLALHELEEV